VVVIDGEPRAWWRVSKATADEFCEHFDFLFGVAAEMKAPIHSAYVGVGEVGSRIC